MTTVDGERPPARVSLVAIMKVFLVIGLTSFGGGASAHIHHAVVNRHKWLDDKRMLEGMTLARILPGTNVSNLSAFVGAVLRGYAGAAVAVAAVVLPGLVVVLAFAYSYVHFASHSHHLQTALRGLGAGAVGIMASLVVNATKLVKSGAARFVAVLAFLGVGVLHANMLLVLVVLAPLASWLDRDRSEP